MKKTGISLTMITVLLVVLICNSGFGLLMTIFNVSGLTTGNALYGSSSTSLGTYLIILLIIGGIACLVLIFILGFTIAAGVLMILTKYEAVELNKGGLVGGILMIISGGIMLVPILNLSQPFLFLLALYFFLKPQVEEKYQNLIYAGIGLCVLAFVLGFIMAIAVIVTQNNLIYFGGFLTNSMNVVGFVLLLVVTRHAKANISQLTPVPKPPQYPYGYPMQYGAQQPPPGYYYPPGQYGYPQQPPGYPPPQAPPGQWPPPQPPPGGNK